MGAFHRTPAALRNDSATDDACALTTSRLRALRSSKMRRTGSLSVDASKVGSRSRSCGADDGGAGLSAKAATEARTDGVARRRAWRDASARSIIRSTATLRARLWKALSAGKCRAAKWRSVAVAAPRAEQRCIAVLDAEVPPP